MCRTGHLFTQSLEAHKDIFTKRVIETPSHVKSACYHGEDTLLSELQDTLGFPKGVRIPGHLEREKYLVV